MNTQPEFTGLASAAIDKRGMFDSNTATGGTICIGYNVL